MIAGDEAARLFPGAEETNRAMLNLLEDVEAEKARLEEAQRATLNILEDFDHEQARLEEAQRATFNVLDDFEQEKWNLERAQLATLNILDDLEDEKGKVEAAERALQVRADELARSNRELEQFAYIASHDLQEPLRTVYGAVSRFAKTQRGRVDGEGEELLSFAIQGAERMRQLILDLLAFSRVGTQAAPLRPVDANAVLARTLRLVRQSVSEAGALVSAADLPWVLADESQLSQVFQNLIGNAIKFRGPQTPRVEIGAVLDGAFWRFHVRDNGIGIAPEDQSKLFVMFQRLHPRTEYPGSGVGLAICKKIVERHGGRIWIESRPGEGTTMFFTMRAAPTGARGSP